MIVRNRFYAKFPACEAYDNRTRARLQKISAKTFRKLFTVKSVLSGEMPNHRPDRQKKEQALACSFAQGMYSGLRRAEDHEVHAGAAADFAAKRDLHFSVRSIREQFDAFSLEPGKGYFLFMKGPGSVVWRESVP